MSVFKGENMTNLTQQEEIQLEADLATLRDIVDSHVSVFPNDEEDDRFESKFMSFSRDRKEGSYRVTVRDEDVYGHGDNERVGAIAMGLLFNESLEVQKADIIVEGSKGGGFSKPVDKSKLGSFVTGITVHVLNELSYQSHD